MCVARQLVTENASLPAQACNLVKTNRKGCMGLVVHSIFCILSRSATISVALQIRRRLVFYNINIKYLLCKNNII